MSKARGSQRGAQPRTSTKQPRYVPFRHTWRDPKQFNQRRNARNIKDKTYSHQRPSPASPIRRFNVILEFNDLADDQSDASEDDTEDYDSEVDGDNSVEDENGEIDSVLDDASDILNEDDPYLYLLNEDPEVVAAAYENLPVADLRLIGRHLTNEWIGNTAYQGAKPLQAFLWHDSKADRIPCRCELCGSVVGVHSALRAILIGDFDFHRWDEHEEIMRICSLIAPRAREAVMHKLCLLLRPDILAGVCQATRNDCYEALMEEEIGRAFCRQADFDVGWRFCETTGLSLSVWTRRRGAWMMRIFWSRLKMPVKWVYDFITYMRDNRQEAE